MKKIFKRFTRLGFDRSFSKGVGSQLAWLAGIMIVVFIVLALISYFGGMYRTGDGNGSRLVDILFVLIDPGSGSEAMSSPLTIICAVLGLIVFSGMLISVISNVLERRVESYNKGETTYRVSNHVVVLGFNKSVPSLIEYILDNKYKSEKPYILIMSSRDIEETRDWLNANLANRYEDNIILMNGVRTSDDDLVRLRLSHNVREIYVLGDDGEMAHDAVSMKCAERIAAILEKEKVAKKVDCHVQLDSMEMFSALQKTEVGSTIREKLNFLPFNFNEIWAHKALATIPDKYYKSLDGVGITKESEKHVHLIVVGMNPFSWSLAVNAAHILHFPNFKEGDISTYSTITFIDKEVGTKGKEFRSRYKNLFDLARWREVDGSRGIDAEQHWIDPIADDDSDSPYKKHLGPDNFMDIQWEFIEGTAFDRSIQNYMELVAAKEDVILTIALCKDESDKNSSICLSLPEAVRLGANEILVRQNYSDVLVETLRNAYGFENIRAFGMMNECYKENLISDKYGKLINASYKNCSFDGSEEDRLKMESYWEECSPLDRWSSNYCANMLFVKLRFLGLDTSKLLSKEEIDNATSEANHDVIQKTEHNRWNTERLLLGMRPLFSDEFDDWKRNWKDKTKEEMRPEKNRMKVLMKHIDICSNEILKEVDKDTVKFDTTLNEKLSDIYGLVIKDVVF